MSGAVAFISAGGPGVGAPVHHIHCKSGTLQPRLQYLRNPRLVFYDQ